MITFKYQGKIITTPNLDKKLKRMKLSLDDIEIIDNPIVKKKEESGIEDYMLDKEQIIIKSKLDDLQRVCYVPKGTRPPINELLKKQIWNPITKTGVYTQEFLESMYYEEK